MYRLRQGGLTKQEITDGWISLFDGETTYGWIQEQLRWSVNKGVLEATEEAGGLARLETTTPFGDFELRFECQSHGAKRVGIVQVRDSVSGAGIGDTQDKWVSFQIRAEGSKVTIKETDPDRTRSNQKAFRKNRGPLALTFGGSGTLRFRNIQLRPLGLESLFNGKDLTGWKEIPGHKSVYSVTPEGWLNVKNGNGQLQSTSEWGDFVLQLEIFANGTHLNSGVFFRETAGAFWNGYEAQIRNQWTGEDRNKPVDYGTGGLYNRQSARKVVSSDREWFTMTILAASKHYSCWVNGYQVSDFTDLRSENQENARSGARTKAGVLGLQGHDPTTDLSFRNIRISALPAEK